jgi:hypothetical protein
MAKKKAAPKKKPKPKKLTKKELEAQRKKDFNLATKRLKKQNITLQSGISSTTSVIELKRRGYSSKEIMAIGNAFAGRRRPPSSKAPAERIETTAEKRFRAEAAGTTIGKASTKPKGGKVKEKKKKKAKTVAAGKPIEANVRQGNEKKSNATVVSRAMVLKPRKSKTSKGSNKSKGKQRNNQGRRR